VMEEKETQGGAAASSATAATAPASAVEQSGATKDAAAAVEHVATDRVIPMTTDEPSSSYSMLEPRMKKVYGAYYKELYYTPERRVLDPKVQELISIAASLVAKCDGCIDGHMKKALALGVTKEEISEAICIAAAINAAAMIDLSDRTAARLGLNHFPNPAKPRE